MTSNFYDYDIAKLSLYGVMVLFSYFLLVLPFVFTTELYKNSDCKNFKCPAFEDPVCVKVSYNKGMKNKSYHVIALNECEVGYMKCHPGFTAAVVPLKNCDHSLHQSKTIKRRARAKRDVTLGHLKRDSSRVPHYNHKIIGRVDYQYGDHVSTAEELEEVTPYESNVKQKLTMKEELSKEVASHEVVDIGGNNPTEQILNDENIENEEINTSDNEIKKSNEDTQEINDSKEAMIELEAKSEESKKLDRKSVEKDEHDAEEMDTVDKSKNEYKDQAEIVSKEIKGNDQNKYSSGERKLGHNQKVVEDVPEDYDKVLVANVKMDEYNKDCPSVCPSRDIMLCARCSHGIYRTFMSVCHLRVFACKHNDERVSLVSRKPCIQSAPYLSDLSESSGRLSEPSDQDRVLQFIRCRAKGLLKKDDPKCTFDDI